MSKQMSVKRAYEIIINLTCKQIKHMAIESLLNGETGESKEITETTQALKVVTDNLPKELKGSLIIKKGGE